MSLLAAVAASLAAALSLPGRARIRVVGTASRHLPTLVLVLLPGAVAAVVVLRGRELVLGLIGLLVLAAVHRLLARHRAATTAEASADRVTEFCESMAAELAAGRPPHRVLERSVEEFPEFASVATAARLGSDVPASLQRLARRQGCADLRLVGAAWHVAQRSGSGMAVALEQVGRTIRERRRASRLVTAELAAAHATARMMAALPVVFALAGSGLGVDPLAFLLGTSAGLCCLAVGLALSYAGLAWLQRIADAVTR
ncbi:MAG: type II secretion system F family protein [Actinomycetota bacterium]|nr:type II secretion system F family protein [Actinomycetota bacterium]